MPAVTQRIDNYLGGVSRQSDDKKLPGQVRECLNGYPDPTFGLTKRPGFKWISNLGSGTTFDDSKWFYIARTDDEKYIGCITPSGVTVTGNGTSGATNKTSLATTASASGANMKVDLTATSGVVSAITIVEGGSGFVNNEVITIASGVAGTGANVTGTVQLGGIHIWNASTGVACTITYGNSGFSRGYLTGRRVSYDILTVQDQTIISNNLVNITKQADPTFNANRKATLVLNGSPVSNTYTVIIEGNTITHGSGTGGTYDSVLTALKNSIDALGLSGLTVTKLRESLQILDTNSTITISASGGQGGDAIYVFQDQVDNLSKLPEQSAHDHLVKVMNTNSPDDTWFAKFVADNGVSGPGHWGEGKDPSKSPGLGEATMPHELINSALNTFEFRRITWTARTVGDDVTNSHPSFVDNKINSAFYYNNRLGFLSDDNISMSQSQDFFNFYHTSAQAVTDADPIDLTASTIKPATLYSVLPTTQGLLLFSKDQQFMLSSDTGVLTPTTTNIKVIANYDMDTEVRPVDMGGIIQFISKTPSYTRTFGMQTFGQDDNPKILDIGRVVNEWVPESVDTLIASPQNKFITLSSQDSRKIYFYRTYSDGKETLVEAWFNWELPGTVQTIAVDSDALFTVTKQGSQFTLSEASLSQSPIDAIIVNNQGQRINPCMDLYATASSVTYDTPNKFSKCYIPWNNITTLTPVIVIKGTTATGQFIESGFTTTPTVASETAWQANTAYAVGDIVSNDGDKVYTCDQAGTSAGSGGPTGTGANITDNTARWDYTRTGSTYFKVLKKDLTSVAADVVVGWKYDLDVILPKTYFRLDEQEQKRTDFTSSLTINRMKFALGLSGVCGFKLKSTGILQGTKEYTGDGSTTVFNWINSDLSYVDEDQVKVKLDGVVTTAFTVSALNQITFNTAPANKVKILIYLDEWYNLNPTTIADTYLGNDIGIKEQSLVQLPIHQRNNNFQLRIFNDSPFPVSLNSMMWEGQYSPRFYRRQ